MARELYQMVELERDKLCRGLCAVLDLLADRCPFQRTRNALLPAATIAAKMLKHLLRNFDLKPDHIRR